MQRDHHELIRTFIDFTGSDETQATRTLEAFKWNLEEAVNYYLEPNGNPLPQPSTSPAAREENEEPSLPPLGTELGTDDVAYPPARANSPLGFDDNGSANFPVHPSNIHQALANPNLYSPSPFSNPYARSSEPLSGLWSTPQSTSVREVNIQWGSLNEATEDPSALKDNLSPIEDSSSRRIDFHGDDIGTPSQRVPSDLQNIGGTNFESRFSANKSSEDLRFGSNSTFGTNHDSVMNENDYLEEEMLRAAIEASKQEAELIRIANMGDDAEPSSLRERYTTRNSNPNYFEDEPENDFHRGSFHSTPLDFMPSKTSGNKTLKDIVEKNLIDLDEEGDRDGKEYELIANENVNRKVNLNDERSKENKALNDVRTEMKLSDDEEEDIVRPHAPLLRRNRRHSFETRKIFDEDAFVPPESNAALNPDLLVQNPSQAHFPPLNHSNDFDHFSSQQIEGISSEDREMAAMYESAYFGIPYVDRSSSFTYPSERETHIPSPPFPPFVRHSRSLDNNLSSENDFPSRTPSFPELAEQRLIREIQDDEYMASLAADQEKEKETKREEERKKKEKEENERIERERKENEEKERQEMNRELSLKKERIVAEPAADHSEALTLLIRMPDGSRIGRRFLKSDTIQNLFDYIDVTCVLKPGSYRLVRQFPRSVFTQDLQSDLGSLGFNSKQEALYLEYIG